MYVVLAMMKLHDADGTLREGERFLQRFPGSAYFSSIRDWMDNAVANKKKVAAGREMAAKKVAAMVPALRANPCATALVYVETSQASEARRDLRACIERRDSSLEPGQLLLRVVEADIALADWPAARADRATLAERDEATYRGMKPFLDDIPSD
jgi:hypothetical protein